MVFSQNPPIPNFKINDKGWVAYHIFFLLMKQHRNSALRCCNLMRRFIFPSDSSQILAANYLFRYTHTATVRRKETNIFSNATADDNERIKNDRKKSILSRVCERVRRNVVSHLRVDHAETCYLESTHFSLSNAVDWTCFQCIRVESIENKELACA